VLPLADDVLRSMVHVRLTAFTEGTAMVSIELLLAILLAVATGD
jgi:hypothetical protein